MKLIAHLKLHPTPEQHAALLRPLEGANAACNAMSDTAWRTQTFRHFDLHKLCYESRREAFGLSAQLTVRCLSKVADAYKLDRKVKHLRQLATALHIGKTAVIGQMEIAAAATGLGGIGKTQLACEFVHRYGQFFRVGCSG